MADGTPPNVDALKQVLDRLNDVMAEAARLRNEVIRQLDEHRAGQQQQLSPGRKRTASKPRASRKRGR
jgi:hypothetical protein